MRSASVCVWCFLTRPITSTTVVCTSSFRAMSILADRTKATTIFTPSTFPQLTYVDRTDLQLEQDLRDALDTPGDVIAISGPSKSGKTVLVQQVVGEEDLIVISGAGIASGEQLWKSVINWMGGPVETIQSTVSTVSASADGRVSGSAGVPFLSKGEVSGGAGATTGFSRTNQGRQDTATLAQVADEIADSSFVLMVDDFHYIPTKVQVDVAKQLKAAAEAGIKIVVASVPHRSDDAVRGNPELRGRLRALNLKYWNTRDLAEIANLGFPALNLEVDSNDIEKFAEEAVGSPQLMQGICLSLCHNKGHRTKPKTSRKVRLSSGDLSNILEDCSNRADYSSLLKQMAAGPKQRGSERKVHEMRNGVSGDVYDVLLAALASDPPLLEATYAELQDRCQSLCSQEAPRSQSIWGACEQITKIADEMNPGIRIIDWDADQQIFNVVDPYWVFYLRHGYVPQLQN